VLLGRRSTRPAGTASLLRALCRTQYAARRHSAASSLIASELLFVRGRRGEPAARQCGSDDLLAFVQRPAGSVARDAASKCRPGRARRLPSIADRFSRRLRSSPLLNEGRPRGARLLHHPERLHTHAVQRSRTRIFARFAGAVARVLRRLAAAKLADLAYLISFRRFRPDCPREGLPAPDHGTAGRSSWAAGVSACCRQRCQPDDLDGVRAEDDTCSFRACMRVCLPTGSALPATGWAGRSKRLRCSAPRGRDYFSRWTP